MTEEAIPLVQKTKQKRRYVAELKEEIKKVSWTSKEELALATKVVVGSTFFFGLATYFVDLIVRGGLNWIHLVVYKVIG